MGKETKPTKNKLMSNNFSNSSNLKKTYKDFE